MQDPQAPPPVPDKSPKSSEQIRPAGLFSDLKYLAPEASRPVPAPLTRPNKILSRVVLPLVILVVGVAALAWSFQFLPGRATINSTDPAVKPKLQFTNGTHYNWPTRPGEPQATPKPKKQKPGQKQQKQVDPEGEPPVHYQGEYETITNGQQDGGFCDYEFVNSNSQPLELRLLATFCSCSKVEVVLVTDSQLATYLDKKKKVLVPHGTRYSQGIDEFDWVELIKEQNSSFVVVEPKQKGIVRLYWDGRGKDKPAPLHLWANLRVNSKENPQNSTDQKLTVNVVYVDPVSFDPSNLPVARFVQDGGATQDFSLHCWSSTRDLTVQPDSTDPCVTATITPLNAQECLMLEKDLLTKRPFKTRIRSAFRIDVKLFEKKDSQQLSLGVFEKPLPVRFLDKNTGEELKNMVVPELTGTVRGDFKVNGSSENLKIELGSFAARVAPKVSKLWTKPGVELEANAVLEPRVGGISATVSKAEKEADHAWVVTLTISDNVVSGPLPQNLVLVLRQRNSAQTIRIPVTGIRTHH